MRIVYVEDNPANVALMQRIARMGSHEVIHYNEGEKALAGFVSDRPDLILMDLQLAGPMGGLDVVRQLRADGVKTPIVAVTAYAMLGDRERCLEAGCDSYMAKPLPVAELVELVESYARRAPAPVVHVTPDAPPAAAETTEAPVAAAVGGPAAPPTATTEAAAVDTPAPAAPSEQPAN